MRPWWRGLLLGSTLVLAAQGTGGQGSHPHLPEDAACLPCHRTDASTRWATHRHQPCSPYCLACHLPPDMAQHHTIGVQLSKPLAVDLRLTADRQLTCTTCHRLSTPRQDRVRWRAESLFGRLFRRQDTYLTYYLVLRNDRGQLCRVCH